MQATLIFKYNYNPDEPQVHQDVLGILASIVPAWANESAVSSTTNTDQGTSIVVVELELHPDTLEDLIVTTRKILSYMVDNVESFTMRDSTEAEEVVLGDRNLCIQCGNESPFTEQDTNGEWICIDCVESEEMNKAFSPDTPILRIVKP